MQLVRTGIIILNVFFIKGGGVHIIDFTEFVIHDSSIHIVTPGQVHEVKRAKGSYGFVFLFELISFNNVQNIENFLFDHTCFDVKELSPAYVFDTSFASELEHITSQTWAEYKGTGVLKNQVVVNQLSLLMLYCMRKKATVAIVNGAGKNDVYISFRRLLNTQFKSLKKVKDYASALNVTEKQLNEIILQRTGDTAYNFIQKQIILEAKRLLNIGIPTKEVAYELNFMDPAHFSKFFKSQTGFSPSAFKNIHA